jgi:hypothetical protein
MDRLKNKVAVIYENGGAGSTVAKEGAHVYLAGRTSSKLEVIAKEVSEWQWK